MKKAIVAMLLMAVFLLGGGGLFIYSWWRCRAELYISYLCGNNCAGWSYCWCGRYYCE